MTATSPGTESPAASTARSTPTAWDDLPVAGGLDLTTVTQSLREQSATCARLALGREAAATAAWSLTVRGSTRQDGSSPPARSRTLSVRADAP